MLHELQVHKVELEIQNKELRRTQEELEVSRSRYFDLYDQAPIGYLTLSGHGVIREANLTAASMLGVTRADLLHKMVTGFILAEDQDHFYLCRKQFRATSEPQTIEVRMVRADNSCFWANLQVSLPVNGETLITLIDISTRREAEEKINQLNNELERRVVERTAELERIIRELDEFCYALSHEFRAPLARLEGFGAMLLEAMGDQGDTLILHCASRIVAASERLRTVIDSLLVMNRLSLATLHPQILHLSDMATHIVSEILKSIGDRTVTTIIAPDVTARGDCCMMEICLKHLLSNALKYTSSTVDAVVEFGQTTIDGKTVYFVRDNGVGFDMNYTKNIFKPFCKLHHENEFEGVGIGLATVHRIIEKHNGRIWAEGEPGKGATFFFTLGVTGEGR